jgi:hypothetical protein
MNGTGNHHGKQNKPDWQRQISQNLELKIKEWHEIKRGIVWRWEPAKGERVKGRQIGSKYLSYACMKIE